MTDHTYTYTDATTYNTNTPTPMPLRHIPRQHRRPYTHRPDTPTPAHQQDGYNPSPCTAGQKEKGLALGKHLLHRHVADMY